MALWEKAKKEELNPDIDFMIRHIYRQTVVNARQRYIEMVDHLNSLDRSEHDETVSFEQTGKGWTRSKAA